MLKLRLRENVPHLGVFVLWMMSMAFMFPSESQARPYDAPAAKVAVVQGEAQVFSENQDQPQGLDSGAAVAAWNTITTRSQSRLILNWNNGLLTSLGDMSSMFVSVEKTEGSDVPQFQIMEGVVRVATKRGMGAAGHYAVLTPAAAIQPEDYESPVDFIVESYDASSTSITVLVGNVRVSTGGEGGPIEKMVPPCSTVYVNPAKKSIDVVRISPEDAARLVSASTIPGAFDSQPSECIVAAAVEPSPPREEYYPSEDYYYVEDSEPLDFNTYEEITVLPPRAGVGCAIVVPGVGEFVIPYGDLGSWTCDPVVVLPYARRVFFGHVALYYQDCWRDLWWRRNELYRVMYLAQLAGNHSLLWKARHELDYLNVRLNWTDRRMRHLDRRLSALEEQQLRVKDRLPRGVNLAGAISDAFTARNNVQALQRFQKKLRNDQEVQNRLANLTGQELVQLRSRLGQERDLQKRLGLRNGLTRINTEVAQGKLPIPAKKTEIKDLVTQLNKERDPARQEKVESRLLDQLKRSQTTPVPEVLDPSHLNALQKDLNRFPNPEKRGDLEKRVTEIQQSLDTRREAEAHRNKAEEIASQAAREKNPEKQQELLGKLKDLSVPLAVGGLGAVGLQQLHQHRQNVQKQLTTEQDQAKKADLQRTLDDLKKRETGLQQLEQFRKTREHLVQPGEDLKKKEDLQRRLLEDQRRTQEQDQQLQKQRRLEEDKRGPQADQLKQQELLRQQREKERQADLLKRQQEERGAKELELKRQEQLKLEQDKARQQQLLQQQEKARTEELQKQQERSRIQQQEQMKRQQEERGAKELELKRQEQLKLEQDKARHQQLLQQQEKTRTEELRKQQERSRIEQQEQMKRREQLKLEQEKSRSQQLQQQQEKARQQQLQQQQEKARSEELRMQQERSRMQQQEQMKRQQEQMRHQQEQMKLQQDRMRQQQEQSRQQEMRHQQERARQDQLRIQQQKEDEERKRKQQLR